MKTHLDPKRFAAWLVNHCPDAADQIGPNGPRMLYRWRKESVGPLPFVGAVDRVLVTLGVHEWEIPDEVWADPQTCLDCGGEVVSAAAQRKRCDPCRKRRKNQARRAAAAVERKRLALAGLRRVGSSYVREAAS